MSYESQEKVRQSVDWEDNIEHFLPTSLGPLCRAIEVTHAGAGTGIVVYDQTDILTRYWSIKMSRNESIQDFYQRFRMLTNQLTNLEAELPGNEIQAGHFIAALDSSRWASFKADVHNRRVYPGNLLSAYDMATNWVTVAYDSQQIRSATDNVVFLTAQERQNLNNGGRGRRGRGRGGRNQGRGRGSGRNNNDEQTVEDQPAGRAAGNNSRRNVKCYLCGGPHVIQECEHREETSANLQARLRAEEALATVEDTTSLVMHASSATISEELALAHSKGLIGKWDVLLDNCSTLHVIVNPKLAQDIYEGGSEIRINGMGGSISTTKRASTRNFGEVTYCPGGLANVLSFGGLIRDGHSIDYINKEDMFVLTCKSGEVFEFPNRHNLYMCDVLKRSKKMKSELTLVQTVAENKTRFSLKENKQADLARIYARRMAYASDKDMAELTTMMKNAHFTRHDIARAREIYGQRSVGASVGKTKSSKVSTIRPEYIPRLIDTVQHMYVDIFFIVGIPFLISFCEPLGLLQATKIIGRGLKPVKDILFSHIHKINQPGFYVVDLSSDGEGAIGKLTDELGAIGIRVNPVGAGSHVPIIENRVKIVKERFRAIVNTLPYELPGALIAHCIYFIVQRLNQLPSHTRSDPTPPAELWLGRKLDFDKDVRVTFGEFARVYKPNIPQKNSPIARTEPAIALYQKMNLTGSVVFWSLDTFSYITRDKFDLTPMPEHIVTLLNQIAAKGKARLPMNPELRRGSVPLIDPITERPLIEPNLLSPTINVDQQPVAEEDIVPMPITDGAPTPVVVSPDAIIENDLMRPPAPDHRGETVIPNDVPVEIPEVESPDISDAPDVAPTEDAEEVNPPPEPEPPPRYNLRQNRIPNIRYVNHYVNAQVSFKKGMKLYPDEGLYSAAKELDQMHRLKVWEPKDITKMSPSQIRSSLPLHMFLKEKFDARGEFIKLKSRLVVGGNRQDRSLYGDVSSPTVATKNTYMIAQLAAAENRHIAVIDFIGAYLNVTFDEDTVIHVRLEPDLAVILCMLYPEYKPFCTKNGSLFLKLRKALYGCIQSAKLWYEHLCKSLTDIGFKPNKRDPCVWNLDDVKDAQCTICIHVDDIMITCTDQLKLDNVIRKLEAKYKNLQINRGKVFSYLGMLFDFSEKGTVKISMNNYIEEALKEWKVKGTAVTPANDNLFIIRDSPRLPPDKAKQFHSHVATLLYPAKRVRPDILTAIAFLSTRVKEPTWEDWYKLDRVKMYLNGTKELGLRLEASAKLCLQTFIDAAFGVHFDFKSHTGSCQTLGKGAFYFRSAKQKLVTKSSSEAELVAASDETSDAIDSLYFLQEQGYQVPPVTLHQDNKSAMALVSKGRSTSQRTRHINIRYFFIKDRVDSNEIRIVHTRTEDMLADILTKPLQGDLFRKFRKRLLNWEI